MSLVGRKDSKGRKLSRTGSPEQQFDWPNRRHHKTPKLPHEFLVKGEALTRYEFYRESEAHYGKA